MAPRVDKELLEFQQVMEVPSTFEEGFNWTALLGALFVALLMVPGAIYMGLLAGADIGAASQWVTVILFIEVAKRAHKTLRKSEIFVLFFMSGAAMGMPFYGLIWNQYFVRSDAAIANGIAELLPSWYAPAADSMSYAKRTFFHADWVPAIGLVIFGSMFSKLANLVLGYGLFRIVSDVEQLPFPMAPIGAQGVMALAEDASEKQAADDEDRWKWRVFSIGGALGLAFGIVYLLLPTLTGSLTGSAIQIFPIPFSDFTPKTGKFLPAVATGISWDLGNAIVGMVMPFFAMVGSFVGLIATFIVNPTLYHFHILRNWTQGDDTINTMYKNNIDFFFSFQIGIAVAIAVAGIIQVIGSLRERRTARNIETQAVIRQRQKSRGDIKGFWVVVVYFLVTSAYILVSGYLIDWHRGIMIVLVLLGFFYTPLISYVTARLEGMVGQAVEVPFIREASLIFSGYRGVACWFLPIPMSNYGSMTVFYRESELTGTKFSSIWKTDILLYPLILVSSIFFMNFIWSLNEIPSAVYPYADMMWKLNAENSCITYSATLGEYSMFEQAFRVEYLGAGTLFGGALFGILSWCNAPVMFIYGVIRGIGQTMPHSVIPQFIGALLGRYYFQKRLGLKWRQYIPVVCAGFFCGEGLVTTLGVGITFLSKAVIPLPF